MSSLLKLDSKQVRKISCAQSPLGAEEMTYAIWFCGLMGALPYIIYWFGGDVTNLPIPVDVLLSFFTGIWAYSIIMYRLIGYRAFIWEQPDGTAGLEIVPRFTRPKALQERTASGDPFSR